MLTDVGKKIIILYILQILQKYTDAYHPMTQQQIAEKLRNDYGLEVNRSTIKRNVEDLIEAGYGIQYTEVPRSWVNKKTGVKEENSIYTDLYYEHDFTEAELHMLIDGLLFSRSVPYKQRRQLIDKLGKLSSSWFNQRMNHVHCMSSDSPQNSQLFHTIDILDEAISQGKQVRITYNQYGTDLELHPTLNEDGSVKRQTLNPYQMVASEGRYYLICNNDHYSTVSNYRIDRITDIELLESSVKPKNQVEGLENGLNLQDYMYQNLNMFSDEVKDTEFIIQKKHVSLIIDFFGKHVSFHEQEDGRVSCRMKVSAMAMKHWAVEHANIVQVVSPESLVEEIKEEIRKANVLYGTADRRSWILGMVTAFSECVAGGCKRLALSPPLRVGDFELAGKEAYEIIEKHGLLHYREENLDRPEEGRYEWILIAGKQETIYRYLELRSKGYSPAVSLEPFYELLSYVPEDSVHTGYDAFRSWFPE